MKLDDALSGVTTLGFDTAPIIYFIEANPRYDRLVTEVFARVATGVIAARASVITLTEVLVQPVRSGNVNIHDEYRELLMSSENVVLLPITSRIAESAAHLRARYRLRTPDALQIATALDAGCEAFLCNDADLRRVTDLRVIILDELEL